MPLKINKLIRSKRKTLAILVKHDGSVIVRAPMKTPEKAIWEFVEQHRAWIEKKKTEVLSADVVLPKQYEPGETFLFLGESYPLDIVKHQRQPLVFDGTFKLSEAASARAEKVFEHWYRQQARRIIQERAEFYAKQYGFQYQGIKITSARTRWGSCSRNGSLNFSWRLIMAPLEQVDYVVVHELAHTVHHNHSKRFWKKVETVLPDYKERQKWLKKHGPRLML
jgi:predicted metal-dependent hydrolase